MLQGITMASNSLVTALRRITSEIGGIDREQILRSSLGELSLEKELAPLLDVVLRKSIFASQYCEDVSEHSVSQAHGVFAELKQVLSAQASRTAQEYVSEREGVVARTQELIERLLLSWPPFVAAAVESRGFLESDGIKREYEVAVAQMKDTSEKALGEIQAQAEKTISEARTLADTIEQRARRTAAKISVTDAQDQFGRAEDDLGKKAKLWYWCSGSSIGVFIALVMILELAGYHSKDVGETIYHTAIRVTGLTAVAAMSMFSLKVLRAHLHMREHNLHRKRLANSLGAFVESAVTPEQRDMILAHLVDSIASFGHSGLVSDSDDAVTPTKVAIDTITRTLGPRS